MFLKKSLKYGILRAKLIKEKVSDACLSNVVSLKDFKMKIPYYMKFWRHVNLAILKSPYLATL